MTGEQEVSTEDLIRLLVERFSGQGRTGHHDSQSNANGEEIIFDIEAMAWRFMLIRLPKSNQLDVQLSPREREIVRLVARGHSNKIIADVLSISSWTVCTHLRRIFAKMGVTSRAAMVARMPEIDRTVAPCPPGREKADSTHKTTALATTRAV
ncbi:MAG TPA: helix-turn-helix transcriptional regulator [Bryobacteraceae bacterium]|nr:helix-turn-helix transcriptional regulator [Bryobacteraceae bacterium]